MRNIILKIWKGESGFEKWFLFPMLYCLSKIYELCLTGRNVLYKTRVLKTDEVSIPVLAIGNITVGGTGKTPVVEKLAHSLHEMGFNPGIITRGYKRSRQGTFCIDRNNDKATEVGDEALMLARKTKLPVVVGTRRSLAIVEAMRKCCVDIAILDDGFQVKNIKKNVEVVVVKGGERNQSNDLFPLGPCREPISRLRDADVVLVNSGMVSPDVMNVLEGIPTFQMTYRPVHLYNMKHNLIAHYNILHGKKISAFSGLGDNQSFFDLLRSLGADVVREVSFQDHHVYNAKDLERISSFHDVNLIVTTEKDAVKISDMVIPDNLFYLAVEAKIEKEQELIEVIVKKIQASSITLHGKGVGGIVQKHWAN